MVDESGGRVAVLLDIEEYQKALRSQQPQIPGKILQGCATNRYDYFGVDIEKVWLTARGDLPMLRVAVAEILQSLPKEPADEE